MNVKKKGDRAVLNYEKKFSNVKSNQKKLNFQTKILVKF